MNKYFHPDAMSNFNPRGLDLVKNIEELKGGNKGQSYPTDRPVTQISGKDIIGEFNLLSADVFGQEYSRYKEVSGKMLGLSEEIYPKFLMLCESIFHSKRVMKYICSETVKEKTFDWLIARHEQELQSELCQYLMDAFEDVIEVVPIILPVFGTEAELEFQIGHIKFLNVKEKEFNTWVAEGLKDIKGNDAKVMRDRFEKERKQIQGFLAARITLRADPARAQEKAIELAEDSLAMLRFYDPSNFEPRLNGHTTLLGKQLLISDRIITPVNGAGYIYSDSLSEKGLPTWRIDKKHQERMFSSGLDILHDLLLQPEKARSEYQNAVLDTLRIYARVSLAKTFADKVIYMLVSLESILLQNDTESIQQTIGDRVAFAIEKDRGKRMRIVKVVKNIYGLRSGFLHHGKDVTSHNLELLKEFMLYIWKFIHSLIINSKKFTTKTELITALEAIKYS